MEYSTVKPDLGKVVETLFFPNIESEQRLIYWLSKAQNRLLICIYWFTNRRIAEALLKIVRERKVKIYIVTDDSVYADRGHMFGVLLAAQSKSIEIRHDGATPLMHNKYVIIDYNTVITGSFNWTDAAATKNNENVVILQGTGVVEQYDKNFFELWERFRQNEYTRSKVLEEHKARAEVMKQNLQLKAQKEQKALPIIAKKIQKQSLNEKGAKVQRNGTRSSSSSSNIKAKLKSVCNKIARRGVLPFITLAVSTLSTASLMRYGETFTGYTPSVLDF